MSEPRERATKTKKKKKKIVLWERPRTKKSQATFFCHELLFIDWQISDKQRWLSSSSWHLKPVVIWPIRTKHKKSRWTTNISSTKRTPPGYRKPSTSPRYSRKLSSSLVQAIQSNPVWGVGKMQCGILSLLDGNKINLKCLVSALIPLSILRRPGDGYLATISRFPLVPLETGVPSALTNHSRAPAALQKYVHRVL